MDRIRMPPGCKEIIDVLEGAGHQAYIVGGCVRDSLLGREPKDWDICTDAKPSEILSHFSDKHVIETGLRHGTVTVCMEDGHYEVTTFRVDGNYSDHRRPDHVLFSSDLLQDLARRDFTINAMAYSDRTGVIDPFHGMEDLSVGIISCVGDPHVRFSEDALRILRALRFSSVYRFSIDQKTDNAIRLLCHTLTIISPERIAAELEKLLLGPGVFGVLIAYPEVLYTIIPELKPCIGFQQNNPYHQYTVYEHIACAVSNYSGRDAEVKMALLLHDIGKPLCYMEDEKGGHFPRHNLASYDIAETVTSRLRLSNKKRQAVLELVLYHDADIAPTPKAVRRWLSKLGEERMRQLLDVRYADILAHRKGTQAERFKQWVKVESILESVLFEKQCFSLRDMALDGRDILSLGVQEGPEVGQILNALLQAVISGNIPNDRGSLLASAENLIAAWKKG